jgi:4-amino-4-deoxy-L-arabinose transferase-like glycosyltransferase
MTTRRARAQLALGLLIWFGAVLILVQVVSASWPSAVGPTARPDDALAALCGSAGLALLGWLGAAAGCSVADVVLPGGHPLAGLLRSIGERITPVVARRVLVGVLGAALVGAASPAMAATDRAGPSVAATVTGRQAAAPAGTAPTGGLDPSWAAVTAAATSGAGTRSAAAPVDVAPSAEPGLDPSWGRTGRLRPGVQPEHHVVVRRGDTLWDIAARHLGPAATDAEIARAWPLWFTANRHVIGPDPDHLRPGQQLRPPDSSTGGAG